MKRQLYRTVLIAILTLVPVLAEAQSADEVIERYLQATGGRAALAKLTSMVGKGSISVTTPVGILMGTAEVYYKAPNKSRTLIKLDGSAFGIPEIVSDQRFDGTKGFAMELSGNQEITGAQRDAMANRVFPTPLLNYRDLGATVSLAGEEKVGEKDAYVLLFTPKSGPAARMFIDKESGLLVKTFIKVFAEQVGTEVENTEEFSDFRDVDGIRVPFSVKSGNAFQTVVATLKEVTHNVGIEESVFVRPAGQ